MPKAVVRVRDLTKSFGKLRVLNKVSIDIHEGEIFCLLGANAAGKTTLMRCLLGLLKFQSGEISLSAKTGFLPENFSPYRYFRGKELLYDFRTKNISKEKCDSLLEMAGLALSKDRYIREYSRGMIQRLGIALALSTDPEILVLDEPTLGLDPLGQKQVLDLMRVLKGQGKTIFFSSHILSQVEGVCDRLGIISHGRMVFLGAVEELLKKKGASSLEEAFILTAGESDCP